LSRIAEADLCAGCGLCESVVSQNKIRIEFSELGYLRPKQIGDLSPEEDQLISETCPGLVVIQNSTHGFDHPIWGPLLKVRVGHSTNQRLRHHASSGGALSALLLYLRDSGAVDYVVQTAASPSSPIDNGTVESVTGEDIFHAAGSRYAPSAPLNRLQHQLELSGRFAFVGKPCDVAALRNLSRRDPRIIVAFRFRGDGWPGFATARLRDGLDARMSYAESWGGILSKHIQFRCKICADSTGGFADVACADAWYSDVRGYPSFEESDGRSLILSRTPRGEELMRRAIAAGYLEARDVDFEEIAKMQPSQWRRKQLIFSRLSAMALLGRFLPRFKGLNLVRAARIAGPWQHFRSFFGMTRRLLAGKTTAR
jgi:coenzyme F420 hydrogenase subunit beta